MRSPRSSRPATGKAGKRDGFDAIERLRDLSIAALTALEAEDVEEVNRLLETRADMIAAFPSVPGSDQAQRKAMLEAARELELADTRLALALATDMDRIQKGLDSMEGGQAARSAYGPNPRASGQINIVR